MIESKFFVLKLARSGSTMFGKVLNSHPEVLCKNEFLNHIKDQSTAEKIQYFKEFFNKGLPKKVKDEKDLQKVKVLGSTIEPFKYNLEVDDFLKEVDISEYKVILLLRKNPLLQARSLYVVKELIVNTREKNRYQPDKDDKEKLRPIDFDFDKLEELTKRFEQKSQRLHKFAKKLTKNNFLQINYEELIEERYKYFNQVFDYLGASQLPEDFDYSGGSEKMLDDWGSICANFEEINNYPYLKQFV
ncbi:hypothetical protein C7H19_01520 [Aphanothece hegewaldii CCALA 016]|uniref:Sulfotransferase domain-containing protein n=1 Tax=Aphanothece hegewaldii CCALA 016 TaxID=2107694 RepID=A0A2T1M3S4_9CHRO|nr:sulfotransferase domain-containing protein [Aphanothece hegewaldii]PSF39494.1 hypothetical protein C7H19_01520 [Aphanothece hegewaldii CCALA 016]